MFDTLGHFILLIIGFGLVIFIHEFGHFVVAKLVGIRVDQFAIGFGKAALAWRKGIGVCVGSTVPVYEKRVVNWIRETHQDEEVLEKQSGVVSPEQAERAAQALGLGETEYRLNWLPLGGYVKMLGQDDLEPGATSDNPRSYSAKPVWARMAVISAGVILNLISAAILFVGCFMWGVNFPRPIVGDVIARSPAAIAVPVNLSEDVEVEPGMRPGDRIQQVNTRSARKFDDVVTSVALSRADQVIVFEVERDGIPLTFEVEPVIGTNGLLTVGILPPRGLTIADFGSHTDLGFQLALMGLDGSGLQTGMRLIKVNSEPITEFAEIDRMLDLDAEPLKPVNLDFVPGKESGPATSPASVSIAPRPKFAVHPETGESHVLGLSPVIRVATVIDGNSSSAAKAGIKSGDLIARVGAVAWPRPRTLHQIVGAHAGRDLEMRVFRNGEFIDLTVRPNAQGKIGILMGEAYDTLFLGQAFTSLTSDSSADRAEEDVDRDPAGSDAARSVHPMDVFPAGTKVVSVNGQPVDGWSEYLVALQRETDPELDECVVRIDGELPLPSRPVEAFEWVLSKEAVDQLHDVSWSIPLDIFAFESVPLKADNPIEAVSLGIDETWRILTMTYLTLDRLVRGSIDPKNIKGPVGIAHIGTQVSQQGFSYLLLFLAVISVNLAVLNFLPIPILDGEQFVFLLIEKIKGSPVNPRVQDLATIVGLVIIGGVFIFVTFNDVRNLLGGLL